MKQILLNNVMIHNPFRQGILSILWIKLFNWKERKSIQSHLAWVELKMRLVNTSSLTLDQRQRRKNVIELLHTYSSRELFPQNNTHLGSRLPFIKDNYGTLCAMGFILYETGASDYVSELSKHNNNIYLSDVHDGPLFTWLEENGITKDEAVLIQPTYAYVVDPSISPKVAWIIEIAPYLISITIFGIVLWLCNKAIRLQNLTGIRRILVYFFSIMLCLLITLVAYWVSYGILISKFYVEETLIHLIPLSL